VSLTRRHRLLEVLLDCLLGVLRRAATTDGRVSSDSPELAGGRQLQMQSTLYCSCPCLRPCLHVVWVWRGVGRGSRVL
jgi:hypothetical protein